MKTQNSSAAYNALAVSCMCYVHNNVHPSTHTYAQVNIAYCLLRLDMT